MHFRFEQSWFLLLLLALPLIWFCKRRMKSPSLQFGPARVFENGLKSAVLQTALVQKTLFYITIATLIFFLARPQLAITTSHTYTTRLEFRPLLISVHFRSLA